MDWMYNGKVFDVEPIEYVGFVYLIENIITGKKYIGKKLFWQSKTVTIRRKTKTVKRKAKKIKIESDWKMYWSSSIDLQRDVEALGEDKFNRSIIHLCRSKGEMGYLEAKEQFANAVLEYPNLWYNRYVGCRVNHTTIKNLIKSTS
jgi:hypothetical protein